MIILLLLKSKKPPPPKKNHDLTWFLTWTTLLFDGMVPLLNPKQNLLSDVAPNVVHDHQNLSLNLSLKCAFV